MHTLYGKSISVLSHSTLSYKCYWLTSYFTNVLSATADCILTVFDIIIAQRCVALIWNKVTS